MFKRTKGYLLLTLLVLTGLAGRLHSDILPGKERKHLVQELKNSKTSFLNAVERLNSHQLNFRAGKNAKSIKQCIYELALQEENLWKSTRSSFGNLTQNGRNNCNIKNADLTETASKCITLSEYKNSQFKNVEEAINCFRQARSEQIRYAKTTTDNPIKFTVITPAGITNAHQAMLLSTAITREYTRQIQQIITHPDFPK